MKRIPVAGPSVTDLEVEYVKQAAETDWYGGAGEFNGRFESAFAEYLGVRYAISDFGLITSAEGNTSTLTASNVGGGARQTMQLQNALRILKEPRKPATYIPLAPSCMTFLAVEQNASHTQN